MDSNKDSFYYPRDLSGHNFLAIQNTMYSQSEKLENGIIQLIECDISDKSMKVRTKENENVEWTNLNVDELVLGDIVDTSSNGRRWEGGSLHGFPYGYGCIYNEENQLTYSGFMFKNEKVCYGVDFYHDTGCIEYIGGFYKNSRYGKGILYDKKNQLAYDGEWENNQPVKIGPIMISKELTERVIHFGVTELEIERTDKCSLSCIRFINYPHLTIIKIDNYCFDNKKSLAIINCNELKKVIIGEYCFHKLDKDDFFFVKEESINDAEEDDDENDINDAKEEDDDTSGEFICENCKELENIEIGCQSFSGYAMKIRIKGISE